MIPVRVISLKRSTERREAMMVHLAGLGLDFSFFEAFDGRTMTADAIAAMQGSVMLKEAFGEQVIGHYVHTGNWEQFEYDRRVTDWELKRGFERS